MENVVEMDLAPPLTKKEEIELAQLRPNPENGNYEQFIQLLQKQERHDKVKDRAQ